MDSIVEWLALFGAAVGFGVGLYQNNTAQSWKRTEFVAAEAEKFFNDAKISTALLLIDYNVIRLTPEGKRALKGQAGHVYTDDALIKALAVHTKFEDEVEKFSEDEMLAREAFDALLTGLESFDHHIQAGLITMEDVQVYFRYWLPKLSSAESGWKGAEFYVALHAFIDAYEYRGVQRLFRTFGTAGPRRLRPTRAA